MRYYQPIWKELKEKKVVTLTANRRHHPRIVKAVVKEKWMDFAYKALMDSDKVAILSHETRGSVLTFTLELKDRKLNARDLGLTQSGQDLDYLIQVAETLDKGLPCHETQIKPPSSLLEHFLARLRRL